MSATTPPGDDALAPELIVLLEAACDRFEAAWKSSGRPSLEDHLDTMPAAGRPTVFLELMTLELAYRRRAGERPEPGEYHRRFPTQGAAVDASFAALIDPVVPTPDPVPPRPAAPRDDGDRNLLFGVLAWQMDFISRDAVIRALDAWVRDKPSPLGSILVAQGALDARDREMLEPMVARHVQMHGDDPARSLASLSSVATLLKDLGSIADPLLQATLTQLGSAASHDASGGERTAPFTTEDEREVETGQTATSVGEATMAGGRFRILRFHDRGALGEVFVARDQELHRDVALKQIKREHADDAQRRARFMVEAEITGGLEHPGVVPVYGLGQDDLGRPFYAMRFIKGDNLKSAIEGFHQAKAEVRDRGERALELRRLLGRFLDVCNAVAYAHSRGVLHRDLKPGNIMLGKYGETLVVDWGLAKAAGRDDPPGLDEETAVTPESGRELKSTELGERIGTPAFMSPEQAAGSRAEVGPACDVYSLGATLYCLLTGKPPFADRELVELLRKVERGEFPPPRAVNPEVNRALDSICCKAMALRPEDRYNSPRALADDIEQWLADEPVAARPESAGERFGRWLRRHLTWERAAMVALLLVALLPTLSAALVDQARRRAAERGRELNTLRRLADTRRGEAEEGRREADRLRNLAEERQIEAVAQRFEAERRLARLALDQGLNLCAQGDGNRGMLWLARSLQIAPANAYDLQRAIRINLDAWSHPFHRLLEMLEHDSPVLNVEFRPDGKVLATVSDGKVRLWHGATFAPIGQPLQYKAKVIAVTFSPDGKLLATAGDDNTARLWDAASLSPIGRPLQHGNSVRVVRFSPDGKVLATAGDDETAQLWDAATLKLIGPALQHGGSVRAVAFSPDGKVLATACDDGMARIWDAATLKPIGPPLHHASRVIAVAFSPDGKTLATACWDKTARIWDADTLKPSGPPLQHRGLVSGVNFSPDGEILATACDDGTVRIWDAATFAPIGPPLQHNGTVYAVTYSPGGKILATACIDGTARIWDASPLKPIRPPLQNRERIQSAAFSPDGKILATASLDAIQLWDADTLKPIVGPPLQHQGPVEIVTFSPDGKVLATASSDNTARLWDTATLKPIGRPLQHQGGFRALTFSPDGKTLATASLDAIQLWDAATQTTLGAPRQYLSVQAVAFSPDGKLLATASVDKTARLWDAATLKPIGLPLQHQGPVLAVTFSPDGKLLFAASFDGTARLWDAATFKPIGPPLQHEGRVIAVAFSPGGELLGTASDDGTAQFWDTATLKPVGPPLRHKDAVRTLVFRPDGKNLATASEQSAVHLWDVPTPKADDAEWIVQWTQVLSAMTLETSDATTFLSARDWEHRRDELEKRKALPRLIRHPAESEVDRLRRAAALSESSGQWLVALGDLERLIAALPGDGSLHAQRGDVLSRLRRWTEAEGDYGQAIRLGAAGSRYPALYHSRGVARAWLGRWAEADADFATDVDQRGNTNSWFYHALLRLHVGDIDGYRDTCAQMLDRYSKTSDFAISHRLARAFVLAPDAVVDLGRPAHLGDRVTALAPDSKNFREITAATYYRAGRYEAALAFLEQASRLKPNPDGDAYGNLFRAMAHDRLGHHDEARRWLDLAVPSIDWEIPERHDGTVRKLSLNWDLRLILPLLRREAEAQIKEGRPLYLPANVFQEESGPARSPASRDR